MQDDSGAAGKIIEGGPGDDAFEVAHPSIRAEDLVMRRAGDDLVMEPGEDDGIRLVGWCASGGVRSIGVLQLVSHEVVVRHDFLALAQRFDQALAEDPSRLELPVGPLLGPALPQSDGEAVGGALAHRYATAYAQAQGYGLDEQALRESLRGLDADVPQPVAAQLPRVDPWSALQAGTALVLQAPPLASVPLAPLESPASDALVFAAWQTADARPFWAHAQPGLLP